MEMPREVTLPFQAGKLKAVVPVDSVMLVASVVFVTLSEARDPGRVAWTGQLPICHSFIQKSLTDVP